MLDNKTKLNINPFFGSFILETLTVGMYEESRNAIREYIQNGFDSIQRAIKELKTLPPGQGRIDIHLPTETHGLVIRDNGTGIPSEHAVEVLTRVGASSKDHRKSAGFRGIGRLAGIVFSNTVTFTTKAKGEAFQTTVVIDAAAMRAEMSPDRTSSKSASRLLNDTVTAYSSPTTTDDHFFEVRLDDLRNPPIECVSAEAMSDFVGQVGPVPYSADFPYLEDLQRQADASQIPIEQVQIVVHNGQDAQSVVKPYGKRYAFESGHVTLSNCQLFPSPTNAWWAWVGIKDESGSYTDPGVSGLRARVRNIQIDERDLVRRVFADINLSYARFQDYYLGEIFFRPGVLVPNARRDGFEDNPAWHEVVKELAVLTQQLASDAYAVSRRGSTSLDAIKSDLTKMRRKAGRLRRKSFSDTDQSIDFSKSVAKLQRRVANALTDATFDVVTELDAIRSELDVLKHEALVHIGGPEVARDREAIQQDARSAMLQEILVLLEVRLSPDCFASARSALLDEYDYD